MKTALYYPNISIRKESLLKQALFLWDSIDVIDPYGSAHDSENSQIREAQELIVRSHYPTPEEKQQAHDRVVELAQGELPSWLFVQQGKPCDFIFSEKFMKETWQVLLERNLIRRPGGSAVHQWSSEAFALVLMAILADCCAGQTKRKITDRIDAYRTLGRLTTIDTGGAWKEKLVENDKVLVSAAVKSLDLSKVSLKQLLRLRKKELGNGGHSYTELRHKLLAKIEDHAKVMATTGYSSTDRTEVERMFEEEVKRDYADVAAELGYVGRDFVFSKELGGLVVATAASIMSPDITATCAAHGVLAVGSGGLLTNLFGKYRAGRKKVLKDHFSSYLYLAKQSTLAWDFRLI